MEFLEDVVYPLPTKTQREIRRLVTDPKATSWQDDSGRRVSKEFGALLISDNFGAYLLRPNGDVITEEDDPDAHMIQWDSNSILLALVHASRRYPSLKNHLPPRSEAAVSCDACKGTGRRQDIQGNDGPECPACASLGWHFKNG